MSNGYKSSGKRVALFGGSFDPPHIGHTAFCAALANDSENDAIWVLPSADHPFGKDMAPFDQRMEMCRIAFASLSPKVEIRDDELELEHTGYTVDLIRYLNEKYPEIEFILALGADNYAAREEWKDFDTIEKLVRVKFYGRRGWEGENEELQIDAPFPRASSSAIRNAIRKGELPRDVLPQGLPEFIREHRLYQD